MAMLLEKRFSCGDASKSNASVGGNWMTNAYARLYAQSTDHKIVSINKGRNVERICGVAAQHAPCFAVVTVVDIESIRVRV